MAKKPSMAKKPRPYFPEGSKKHEMAESPSMERKDGKKDPKGSFGARKDKGKNCK